MSPVLPQDLLSPLAVISRFRTHDGSLADFLAARIEAQPEAPALEFEGKTWTYAQLGALIADWRGWLQARGVAAGGRVGVMALNDPNTVALMFALAGLGAMLVPLNPEYGVEEAAYVLGHAQVRGVLCTDDKRAVVEAAVERAAVQAWVAPLQAPATAQATAPGAGGQADDCCLVIYTSGTTGFPKGAMHGQRGYVLTAEAFVERLWLQPDERVLCVMPMFHINALMYSVGGAFACGGTLVLVRRFSASSFWQVAAATRATEVNLVAAAGTILTQRPAEEFVPHMLRKMFVAPQTPAMVEALHQRLQVPVLIECYGMTEIPGVISNPFHGPHRVGTMGVLCRHPDPRVERPQARIVDDAGQEVAPGQTGELLIRTPTLMQGYLNDPAQTAAAFLDGWFRTGDLVLQGEDGYYRFVARKKDIIRRRGENIAAAEVERVLLGCPGVQDVAVIGVPSELGEEELLAAVVASPTAPPAPRDIARHARAHLSAAKVPRYLRFVDAIPMTPTHKPAKHRLKSIPGLVPDAIDLHAIQDHSA